MRGRILPRQVSAARSLKGWGQTELAHRCGLSQVTIAHIESGKVHPKRESMLAIRTALENAGIEFLPNGVRTAVNSIRILDGVRSIEEFFEDIHYTVAESGEELLFFGSMGTRAKPLVIQRMKELRKAKIPMRSLNVPGDLQLRGPLKEYRYLPKEAVPHQSSAIYGSKVAFVLESEPSFRFLIIRSEIISEDHRRIFEYFWKKGKKATKTNADPSEWQ